MGKKKYLAKNIGLLTISSFATKILTFFLVPLYTNVLTTAEYGAFDLINSTIGLLIPILTLNAAEAVLRFSLDADTNKKQVYTIGVKFAVISVVLVTIFTLVNSVTGWIPVFKDYKWFFIIYYLLYALFENVSRMARGLGQIADIAIAGVLCSSVTIALNILLLLVFNMGLTGYFLATIIGLFVNYFYLFIRIKGWRLLTFKEDLRSLQKEMLEYCRPLIANSVGWWVNNLSDRYIVTWFCGVGVNGIYSIGYKIPTILNVFQGIFSQAWSLSAVKDFDPEDKDGFFSKMYNSYNFTMVLLCSGLIMFDKIMARFMYAKDFYAAWKFVPFLLISVVLGAMAGYIGGIFTAVKDSKLYARTTVAGAVVNIILNLILVSRMGAMGAAIATLVAYYVVWVIRIVYLKKYIAMKIQLVRDHIAYLVLLIQSIGLLLMENLLWTYTLQVASILAILLLFRREIGYVWNQLSNKFLKR